MQTHVKSAWAASLLQLLSLLPPPSSLYCYLAYFVHINISRASWQRPQRPQPAYLPPPLCAVLYQFPSCQGPRAHWLRVLRCGWQRGEGARGRVTWFDLYVQLCVCACVRRIFRISFLNYASFGLRHLSKYFRNAVSLFANPPSSSPPPSVTLQGILLHTFCNYGSTSTWAGGAWQARDFGLAERRSSQVFLMTLSTKCAQ